MKATRCYCAADRSQQGGELQRLVGQGSTCDWCNTWTESLLFSLWGRPIWPCALHGTGQTGLRLNWLVAFALSLPQHLLSFSWEKKKSSPQTWNSGRPTLSLLTPQPCPTCLASHSSQGGWGDSSSLWSGAPVLILFLPCSHFLKRRAATHV